MSLALRRILCASILLCTTAAVGRAADNPDPAGSLLDVVRRTVDALVDHGRDRWGERKTAMIASMLDRKKLAPPEKMPKGSAGVRESDRTNRYGSNADMQQNLYRTMFLLSELTDNPRYGKAAEDALVDFVRYTQSPETHLLGWGEHLFYDMQTEQTATNTDAGRATLIHEIKKPLGYWNLLYAREPERMLAYAHGLWEHQIFDHKTGDFSRHTTWNKHDPRRGYDFTKEAGYMIEIWSRAQAAEPDPVYTRAISVLTKRYTDKLNDLDLLDYDGTRKNYCNNGHNVTLAMECSAAADRLGPADSELAERLRTLATRIDRGYLACRHAPDDPARGFIATCLTNSGEPCDREAAGPGGNSVLWGLGYGKQTTAMNALHCYHRMRQLPEGPTRRAYRDLFLAAARTYRDAKLPETKEMTEETKIDVWPVEPGLAIQLEIAAYRETNDAEFLKAARRLADESVAAFWNDSSPLPKASLYRDHYEAMTGADALLLALLAVHTTENKSNVEVPISDVDR